MHEYKSASIQILITYCKFFLYKVWKILLDYGQSKKVTFILRKTYPPILIENKKITQRDNINYFGYTFDRRYGARMLILYKTP